MRPGWATLLFLGLLPAAASGKEEPIDRRAVVERHQVVLTRIDPHAPLMLGNGNLGFTADITGLQTFPEAYSPLAPLLTMAQWAWHAFPNPQGFSEADGLVKVPVPGRGEQPYPWIRDWSEVDARPALKWLRENPHRFSLGRIALQLRRHDGSPAKLGDLAATEQRLDPWTGALTSRFSFEGQAVEVETRVHPGRDMILVSIRSPLVAQRRAGVELRFPGISPNLNPDPSDWANDDKHRTILLKSSRAGWLIERRIDATRYYSTISAPGAQIRRAGPHRFGILARSGDRLEVMVSFDRAPLPVPRIGMAAAVAAVGRHWRDYWSRGGMIDFSGSTDTRAFELERRVVLSQYLAAINEAGEVPPQEEGLFSNSWNGKFHLEVHPLHAGHFATWGRPEQLERSLGWYLDRLEHAKAEAARHQVDGAWWSKMSGLEARNTPSTVNPFIMWQQPSPIWMAELVWRARRDRATLERYAGLVDQTARLLASWPRWDAASGTYRLGPPIIPVQENHPPLTTVDPAYELAYFRWGLETAQSWRLRRGLKREPQWDRVIAKLAPLPVRDGKYLPVASAPDFWRDTASRLCSRHAVDETCLNRDHPSFLMAYGLIPGSVDPAVMRNSLAATEADWDLRQTWGWDFPIVAMTAARLGDPDRALDWLFRDLPNNQWGISGMTPRFHLEAHTGPIGPAAGTGRPDEAGYRRAAETYFPSNGSLLLAVGMMAAGWDGSHGHAPGFPRKGWKVRVEGVNPLP